MLNDPPSENSEARARAGWMAQGSCPWNERDEVTLVLLKWLRKGAILDDPALSSFQTSFTILNSCAFSLGQSLSVEISLPRAAGGLTFQQYLQYRPANFRHSHQRDNRGNGILARVTAMKPPLDSSAHG